MDNRGDKPRLNYPFESNGFTVQGTKIPGIPIIILAIKVGRKIARGPAIIDTGFDGGVFPNITLVKLFEGKKPQMIVEFENPTYGRINTELYSAIGYFYNNGRYFEIGKVNIYIPTDPEFLSDEVIVGREILNNFDLYLSAQKGLLTMFL